MDVDAFGSGCDYDDSSVLYGTKSGLCNDNNYNNKRQDVLLPEGKIMLAWCGCHKWR